MTRAHLHRLVDELPEESLIPTALILERARNPFWAALQAAPPDDEPVTADDIEAIEVGRTEIGMSLEEVRGDGG